MDSDCVAGRKCNYQWVKLNKQGFDDIILRSIYMEEEDGYGKLETVLRAL
jgi:hypothetical protein